MYGRSSDAADAAHEDSYHKDGEFTPVSWEQGSLRCDGGRSLRTSPEEKRTRSDPGMFGSGQWTIWGRLCRRETVQEAGFALTTHH